MEKEKEEETDNGKRNSNNSNNRRRSSSNRSSALAVSGTRKTAFFKMTTGDPKLKETVTEVELLFSAINLNDHATNVHDCRRLPNDDIMCATDVLIGGEVLARVCGYGDVARSCAFDFLDSGARVFLVDCDPIGALQAVIEVLQVAAMESVVSEMEIIVSPAGNFNIVSRSTWLAWRVWKG